LIDSLPVGLAPLASQVRLDGTVALHAAVRFDTAHPAQTDAKWELANGCRVREASPLVAPERFREPFILEVPDALGKMTERAFGPGTANWVPLAAMSSHLSDAVLVCEDGRFYRHNGFDAQAIRSSIRDNLLRGKFIRGGSTVSMQLAKNLYLRREKTFSRKLQEAALTLLLEQSFTKNEIMELYWNVVELGPGIYGVGEASQFYFATAPASLSPAQAFYLASILPNPKSLHFTADGRISAGWQKQVRRILTIAHSRHTLSDEELKLSLSEELRFGVATGSSPPAIGQTPGAAESGAESGQEQPEHE
jgi:membrane peptidoglycan carboxypeptidase